MGQFMSARFSPMLRVDEGDATGLLMAIRWAIELNLDHVVFELDSKLVVDRVLAEGGSF